MGHEKRFIEIDGTYSPISDSNIISGLIFTSLPEDAVCVGKFRFDKNGDLKPVE